MKTLEISTKNYTQYCRRLSSSCVYFVRDHVWKENTIQIDTFPGFWTVAIFSGNFPNDCLSLFSANKLIPIKNNQLIYIPPYSLLRWRIKKSQFQWSSFLLQNKLDFDFGHDVSIYPFSDTSFQNEKHLHFFLKNTAPIQTIKQELKNSVIATRLKKWIDFNFKDPIKLSHYAFDNQISSAYLTKEFKSTFAITPHQYLNKVRIYSGMCELLIKGQHVGQTGIEAGFKDTSSFYKNFKNEFLINPSQFRLT